ncbi:MAG: hypothetical protein HC897_06225 [Thermoanaerobaculia bacterium]|nr:hypothetical protein [Thermoanaerobaculia bacterium]
MGERQHTVDLEISPAESLALVAEIAESWGGGWVAEGENGGRLTIPVLAGLRHGFVTGRLSVEQHGEGSRLRFEIEESVYRVQKPALVILLLAAFGALLTVFGLFVPALHELVPLGALLAISAWLVVVARLRNTGPEELFDALVAASEP